MSPRVVNHPGQGHLFVPLMNVGLTTNPSLLTHVDSAAPNADQVDPSFDQAALGHGDDNAWATSATIDVTLPGTASPADLKETYGLSSLRVDQLLSIPEQLQTCAAVLSTSDSWLLDSRTNSGKTVMFLMIAASEISRGGRVIFWSPKEVLLGQVRQEALQFLGIDPKEVVCLNGDTPPQRREIIYNDPKIKLIISTPGSFDNDVKAGRVPKGAFGLGILDEIHRAVGDHSLAALGRDYILPEGLRVVGGSACPARSPTERQTLMAQFGISHYRRLDFKALTMAESVWRTEEDNYIEHAAILLETGWRNQIESLQDFVSHDVRLVDSIGRLLKKDRHTNRYEFPGREDIRGITARVQGAFDNRFKNMEARSKGAELLELWYLHSLITTVGRTPFLNYLGSHLIDARIGAPGGTEIQKFRARLYQQDAVQGAFELIAQGTPYANLFTINNWNSAPSKLPRWQRGQTLTDPADLKAAFFSDATAWSAQHQRHEHPKFDAVRRVMSSRLHAGGNLIVFCGHADQVEFLAEMANHQIGNGQPIATYLRGLKSKSKAAVEKRDSNVARFKDGSARILFTTSAGEEGIHLPKATVGMAWEQTSEPERVLQRLGRVGRSIGPENGNSSDAAMYYLIYPNSSDWTVYNVGKNLARRLKSS